MGFLAEKYWEVGGFAALPSGEDVDLVRRFEQSGLHIRRDASLSVVTSARHDGRAPNGFAAPRIDRSGIPAARGLRNLMANLHRSTDGLC